MRQLTIVMIVALGLGASFGVSKAGDPPDSEVNPVSGFIESVDSKWENSSWSIRYVVDEGQGQALTSEWLTDASGTDKSPRIAIRTDGDTGGVWWRDTTDDEVVFRMRDLATKTWSAAKQASTAGEGSRNPEMVTDGFTFWIAFELDAAGGGTGIAVNGISDSAEPFPTRTLLDTTTFAGDTDVMAHADSGETWVTWVHSGNDVGWSQYDSGTELWSLPGYESYANDTIKAARQRISDEVLGN